MAKELGDPNRTLSNEVADFIKQVRSFNHIRLAGIDEAGATEVLRFIPTEEAVMEKVVSLYDHRKKE